jgi:hypothetical protein
MKPQVEGLRLDAAERAMVVAATVALVSSVVAIGLTARQTLANPSGTVTSVLAIGASGVLGMVGMTAFGLLWLRNIKSS